MATAFGLFASITPTTAIGRLFSRHYYFFRDVIEELLDRFALIARKHIADIPATSLAPTPTPLTSAPFPFPTTLYRDFFF
jgi:hypothetical protein